MFVCLCHAVTDKDIQHAVECGAEINDIMRDLKAATHCGSCLDDVNDIIEATKQAEQPTLKNPHDMINIYGKKNPQAA